jgi:3-isopropylmalate/(R)-2-methylmalate dehydratase small subunit
MEKFEVITAIAAPFVHANVDTDRIIRIERCARVARKDMGLWAFESERFMPDGSNNPEFILNQAPFVNAGILVASENFGCGSSREMAVWAIAGMGIRCVIAPSFGEIFFGNCFQNGLLPIQLPHEDIANLQMQLLANAEQNDASQILLTVNLVQQTLMTPWHQVHDFQVDPLRRISLLEGLDPIALTLKSLPAIEAFESRSKRLSSWVWTN